MRSNAFLPNGVFMVSRSVLAVGAHPDDVVLGIGGALVQLADSGYDVPVLSLTSGELGGQAPEREVEDTEAVRRLGATAIFGRLEDGNVTQRDAIRLISECVRQLAPAMVFAHDPKDTHQDHVNAGRAATVACRTAANLFFYEGPSSVAFEPTTCINVDDVWLRKLHALDAYRSQMDARELMGWVTSVSQFRAWPRHVGGRCESLRVGHAELSLTGVMAPSVLSAHRAFALEA
ncbi:MAG: PIG-L family deacetylase [Candidatus Eremiobacteraeota bacterium]|nr:PIG-L family deacetylase [Candidatus Eremiobacteraeota bacterium]